MSDTNFWDNELAPASLVYIKPAQGGISCDLMLDAIMTLSDEWISQAQDYPEPCQESISIVDTSVSNLAVAEDAMQTESPVTQRPSSSAFLPSSTLPEPPKRPKWFKLGK